MRLWVDFNNIDEDGQIEANLEFAGYFKWGDLVQGAMAELFDGEGYTCRGLIHSVDFKERRVDLRVDWATWRSPAAPVVDEVIAASVYPMPSPHPYPRVTGALAPS